MRGVKRRLDSVGFFKWQSDESFLKKEYEYCFGKPLNLDNPVTYNEKLQWLKLYDRKPIYSKMVDKYEAKKYVADIVGEEYIIPTLGVWDRFEDIDFDTLPDRFVLKCTHDSGGLAICKDKKTFDINKAKKKINKCLKKNFFWSLREWPYKNVKPRIIAEQFMEDAETAELRDYKFFTFGGECKLLFVASERQKENAETKFDFFDMDYNHLDVRNGHPNADVLPAKPKCFDEMRILAEKLSQGVPHLRVDCYEVNGKVYFGELTFSHWSGMVPFEPEEWDKTLGDWITLPEKTDK
ncbi:MAG: glycosyl transferase [Clostridia bacterium]|nr:glycosyl transferase [Clostridia bacterium]